MVFATINGTLYAVQWKSSNQFIYLIVVAISMPIKGFIAIRYVATFFGGMGVFNDNKSIIFWAGVVININQA